MCTPIRDLPSKVMFSIGSDYLEYFNRTPYKYLKDKLNQSEDSVIITSNSEENKCLGWVVFKKNLVLDYIYDVKFRSFYVEDTLEDRQKRRELIQELKNFFDDLLTHNIEIEFIASKSNPFIKHYYSYLKKYGGIKKDLGSDRV